MLPHNSCQLIKNQGQTKTVSIKNNKDSCSGFLFFKTYFTFNQPLPSLILKIIQNCDIRATLLPNDMTENLLPVLLS